VHVHAHAFACARASKRAGVRSIARACAHVSYYLFMSDGMRIVWRLVLAR